MPTFAPLPVTSVAAPAAPPPTPSIGTPDVFSNAPQLPRRKGAPKFGSKAGEAVTEDEDDYDEEPMTEDEEREYLLELAAQTFNEFQRDKDAKKEKEKELEAISQVNMLEPEPKIVDSWTEPAESEEPVDSWNMPAEPEQESEQSVDSHLPTESEEPVDSWNLPAETETESEQPTDSNVPTELEEPVDSWNMPDEIEPKLEPKTKSKSKSKSKSADVPELEDAAKEGFDKLEGEKVDDKEQEPETTPEPPSADQYKHEAAAKTIDGGAGAAPSDGELPPAPDTTFTDFGDFGSLANIPMNPK